MAERDRVIKSGQITLPRILFLALVGGIIVFTVYQGGIFLSIGYWFLTLAICGLLFLVAINYGVKMDKVAAATPGAGAPVPDLDSPSSGSRTTIGEATHAPRPKRRASRPAKRRR